MDDQALAPRRPPPRLAPAPAAAPPTRARTRDALAAAAAAALAGWLVGTGSSRIALGLIVAAGLLLVLLTRPRLGLLAGIALVLTLPYWYRLGAQPLAAYRVGGLLALVVVLDASRTRWTIVDTAFAALLTYLFARAWFSPSVPRGGAILIAELAPAAFYVAARLWWPGNARTLMWVILASATFGALTVVREAINGSVIYSDPGSYSWNAAPGSLFRPGGVFGSPPGAAAVLSMAVFATVPLLRAGRDRARLLAGAGIAICLLAIVLTFTRAGFIALGAGTLLYLVLSRSPLLSAGRILVAGLVLALVALALYPSLQSTTTFQQGVLRGGNLAERESFWSDALPIALGNARTATFGVGVNATLSGRFGGSTPAALAESPSLTVNGTHSEYVLTLLEEGVVGLVLLVGWIALSLRAGVLARPDPVAAGLTAAVLAFAIMASVNNLLLHTPSFSMLALCSGLLAAMSASPARR